ncbi:hypothetical protein ACFE04_011072 [Oxalis oulophora]
MMKMQLTITLLATMFHFHHLLNLLHLTLQVEKKFMLVLVNTFMTHFDTSSEKMDDALTSTMNAIARAKVGVSTELTKYYRVEVGLKNCSYSDMDNIFREFDEGHFRKG